MEKFKDIKYTRPDYEAEEAAVRSYIQRLKKAGSAEEMRAIYKEEQERSEWFDTMQIICSIRNHIDTADAFYEKEVQLFYEKIPPLILLYQEAEKVILESPFLESFADGLPENLVRDMQIGQKLASEAIMEDMTREGQLGQEYSRVIAGCITKFRGEDCNFYGLLKHMQNPDRAVRREAFEAWAALYEKTAPQLDGIYDKLVALRSGMAKKQDFDSYISYRYAMMHRYDYTAEDAARFRRQIKEVVVPVCAQLYEEQKKRLGVDHLYYYDESLFSPEGNALPQGTPAQMVANAQKMYRELSKESGEFFDFMVEHELFDLETRPGKHGGGYCTYLPAYKAPFIFSNFNGTSADVDVLTHEAGHSFAAYMSGRTGVQGSYIFPNNEVAEIHSMSMELITYPWMDLFFGEQTALYKKAHLTQALMSIPYLVCVDEFQHKVFEDPAMNEEQRYALWRTLEREYLPWRNYDGNAFLEKGGFWMQKQHIFLYPFYYIEYALAQMGAFEFYIKFQKDRNEAWEDYIRLCSVGGNYGYFHLLSLAHLSNPFREGTVKAIVDEICKNISLL